MATRVDPELYDPDVENHEIAHHFTDTEYVTLILGSIHLQNVKLMYVDLWTITVDATKHGYPDLLNVPYDSITAFSLPEF